MDSMKIMSTFIRVLSLARVTSLSTGAGSQHSLRPLLSDVLPATLPSTPKFDHLRRQSPPDSLPSLHSLNLILLLLLLLPLPLCPFLPPLLSLRFELLCSLWQLAYDIICSLNLFFFLSAVSFLSYYFRIIISSRRPVSLELTTRWSRSLRDFFCSSFFFFHKSSAVFKGLLALLLRWNLFDFFYNFHPAASTLPTFLPPFFFPF